MQEIIPNRISLSMQPTPIQPLKRVSALWGGPDIFVKRDDLTGASLSGNKVRKLEFLLAEALAQKAQVVITCGGIQSNHARATAIAAIQLGMRAHLVLRADGGGSSSLEGNLFLDRLVDAQITFITEQEYAQVDEIMADLAGKYAADNLPAYIVPEGGSNELGAMGYVRAMEEIATHLKKSKQNFDVIVCAVGSGGTYAGLLLGKFAYEVKAEIWGVNVCNDAKHFEDRISGILLKWHKRFAGKQLIGREAIKIVDGYVGKGYALSRQEEIDTIKEVARLDGILLDPVYTGKAMFGVKDLIARGVLQKNQKLLFLHTGGIFGLFPKKNLFF